MLKQGGNMRKYIYTLIKFNQNILEGSILLQFKSQQ